MFNEYNFKDTIYVFNYIIIKIFILDNWDNNNQSLNNQTLLKFCS